MTTTRTIWIWVSLFLFLGGLAAAQTTAVPTQVKFAGTVVGHSGIVGMTFALYAGKEGGAPLWLETQNVPLDGNGHYTAFLGANTKEGLPTAVFASSEARWLGVQVTGETEQPRILLVSVPYALKAGDAETLGGRPLSSFVLNEAPAVNNRATILAAAPPAPIAPSTPVAMDIASSTGTTNFVSKWTDSTTLGNSLIFDTGTRVGIGTTTPQAALDVNGGVGGSIFRGFSASFVSTATNGPQFAFTNAALPTGASWRIGVPGTANATSFFIYDYISQNAPLTMEKGAGANSLYFKTGGNIGIGTNSPASKLTVAGTIQSTGGGFKFPDASVQTTAAVGTLTGVTAGTGLLGGGTSGTVALNLDTTKVITGVTAGPGLTGGGTSGPVTLNLDTSKVITGVSAGSGLTGGGTSGSVALAADLTALQARVTGTCSSGTALGSIASNGTVSCNVISGGGGSLTLPFTGTGADNPPTTQGVFKVTNTANGPANTQMGPPDPNAIPTGLLGLATGTGIVAGVVGKTTGADGVPIVGLSTAAASDDVPVIVAWSQATSGKATLFNGMASSPNAKGIDLSFAVAPSMIISASVANTTQVFQVDGAGNLQTNGFIQANGNINTGGNLSAQGNLSVGGTVSGNVKTFKIDDPLDPAHKWLYHTSIESPDMKNLYDGVVVLDNHGEAWVTMPDWFEALNRDFRYQLTAIGAPGPKLYIAKKISGNRFKIAGGKKGMEVSWLVTGIRQDAWATDNRTPVLQEKTGGEIGTYYHPKTVTPANSPDANARLAPVH